MPVAALQKALIESVNISITTDGKARLLSHAYLASNDPAEKLSILGTDTRQLIETINHNITAQADDLRFQRKASNHRVPVGSIPAIKQFTQRKGQAFLEEVDLYLSQLESDEEETVELSVSVFYHETTTGKQEPSSGNQQTHYFNYSGTQGWRLFCAAHCNQRRARTRRCRCHSGR